jgi:tRNA threonylcarbamoyladenosine biosynthesis protein TsaB
MLAVDGKPVSSVSTEVERDHAGKVNNLVAAILEEANCTLNDVHAIAVCNGPGSYTGLRIGLATAKGYCYALNKPLILHSRLHLMLRELAQHTGNNVENMLAILPARSGE